MGSRERNKRGFLLLFSFTFIVTLLTFGELISVLYVEITLGDIDYSGFIEELDYGCNVKNYTFCLGAFDCAKKICKLNVKEDASYSYVALNFQGLSQSDCESPEMWHVPYYKDTIILGGLGIILLIIFVCLFIITANLQYKQRLTKVWKVTFLIFFSLLKVTVITALCLGSFGRLEEAEEIGYMRNISVAIISRSLLLSIFVLEGLWMLFQFHIHLRL